METPPAPLTASQGIGVFIFLTTLTRAASWRHRYNLVWFPPSPTVEAAGRRRMVPARVKNSLRARLGRSRSSYGTRGQTGDGGSRQNRVEFYTLHLQRWRHWIWHTTPTPAGASTGCTRSGGILHFYTSFSEPSAHVSAPLVWKELIRQRRKRKRFDALGADTPLHCFFACVPHILSAQLHIYIKAQWVKLSRI